MNSRPAGHAIVPRAVVAPNRDGDLRARSRRDGSHQLGSVLGDTLRRSAHRPSQPPARQSRQGGPGSALTPFSAAVPTMNPVMLTRKTIGTPRCSHSWTNCAAFSAEGDTRTPLLAICTRFDALSSALLELSRCVPDRRFSDLQCRLGAHGSRLPVLRVSYRLPPTSQVKSSGLQGHAPNPVTTVSPHSRFHSANRLPSTVRAITSRMSQLFFKLVPVTPPSSFGSYAGSST